VLLAFTEILAGNESSAKEQLSKVNKSGLNAFFQALHKIAALLLSFCETCASSSAEHRAIFAKEFAERFAKELGSPNPLA
jgi:hypothetical protein